MRPPAPAPAPEPAPPELPAAAGAGLGRLLGFLRSGAELPRWTGRTLSDGTRVGRVLGAGGMCAVYEGTRPDQSPCAVKVLLPDPAGQTEIRRRFEREAGLLLTSGLPGIPRGIATGVQDDLPYVIMERIAGRSLADELRLQGRLEPTRAVDAVRQVLEILHGVHRRGVVHRDLKPANVLLRDDGSLCVLDFGIAKVSETAAQDTRVDGADGLTRQGEFLGTPGYAAPEQIEDARRVTPRSDLYAAGVLLLELLTGRTLAEKPRHERAQQARALIVLEGLPDALGRSLERALAVDPRRRFHSAMAMSHALSGRRSIAGMVHWLLDQPTLVVVVQLACVIVVLGRALLLAWWHEDELADALDQERARAEAATGELARAEDARTRLMAEVERLQSQRNSSLTQLLYLDVVEKYRGLLRSVQDPGGREARRFLVAADGFLRQPGDEIQRARVESMRLAVDWRNRAREVVLRVIGGKFNSAWGDTPDTRVRVLQEGREMACTERIDDQESPSWNLTLRLTVQPCHRIEILVEEGDFQWEPLLRLDSSRATEPWDSVGALQQQADAVRETISLELNYTEQPPPLPATE